MYPKHEPQGMYLEDYEIGKEYVTAARTITEADVVNFAGLSGDFNPIHMDEESAKQGIFGTRIAHGALGYIISTGLVNGMGIAEGTTIAFLECTLKYPAPLKIGDTVRAIVIPTDIHHSSKPGKGILTQEVKLVNQDDIVVMESTQKLMLKSRV